MKRSYKSKKPKKKINNVIQKNIESQFINITTNCDGYAEVPLEKVEDYKSVYFYVDKEDKTLFPFIYHELYRIHGLSERVIINIKKNQFIRIKEGKKITSSL
jgi:hypothetical protein